MRRILVENARRKKSLKHGGDHQRVDITAGDVMEFDTELAVVDRAEWPVEERAHTHGRSWCDPDFVPRRLG